MVFTGRKRERGTSMAVAPSKASTAAPMAVSSWMTGVEEESAGSTVLLFLMSGSPRIPPRSARVSRSTSRSNQRLFVWKKGWRNWSVK